MTTKYSMRYADGGKAKKKKTKVAAQPELLGTGMAKRTADTLRHTRRRQMEALGLKDGGKAKKGKSYKDGGIVSRYPLSYNKPSEGSKS